MRVVGMYVLVLGVSEGERRKKLLFVVLQIIVKS